MQSLIKENWGFYAIKLIDRIEEIGTSFFNIYRGVLCHSIYIK